MAEFSRLLHGLFLVLMVGSFGWILWRFRGAESDPFAPGKKRFFYPLYGLFIGMETIGLMAGPVPISLEVVQLIAEAGFLGSIGYLFWTDGTPVSPAHRTDAPIDRFPGPILELDPGSRRVLRANRSARDLLGFEEDRLPADLEPLIASGKKRFRKALDAVRGDGTSRVDAEIKPGTGEVFSAELSISYDSAGDRHMVVVREIPRSERRPGEEGEREVHYQSLFEESPTALWEEDYSAVMAHLEELRTQKGIEDFDRYFRQHPEELDRCAPLLHVRNVNQKALDLYDVETEEEFRSRRNPPLTEKRRENFRTHLVALLNGRTEISYTSETRTNHGRIIHRRLQLTVAPGFEDDLSKVFVSSQDLTARRRFERELKQSQEFLRALLDANPHKIFVKDGRGRFQMANRSLQTFFGASEQEIVGKTDFDFFDEQTAREIREMDRRVLREGETKTFTTQVTAPADGEIYWHRDVKVPLFTDRPPEERRLMGIGTDITAQHEAQEELREALDEKETLLKEVHHRVRNNLQVISSLLGLEKRRHENEELSRILSRCRSRVMTMALVHRELYEHGDFSQVYFPDYVRELAGTLVETYAHQPERIELEVDVSDVELDLDTVIPCGLIVTELVTNALTHAFDEEGGRVQIRVRSRENGDVSMVVADNGVGGEPSRILDSGQSLGMRLVKNLAENQLKGTIAAESDGGMTFRISFPRTR